MVLFITWKPRLSIRVFLQKCLANSVHDVVATHKMHQPKERKLSVFLLLEKSGEWGFIRTKISKLQYKVAVKLQIKQAKFVSLIVRFFLQE